MNIKSLIGEGTFGVTVTLHSDFGGGIEDVFRVVKGVMVFQSGMIEPLDDFNDEGVDEKGREAIVCLSYNVETFEEMLDYYKEYKNNELVFFRQIM